MQKIMQILKMDAKSKNSMQKVTQILMQKVM